jgi:hypothetical protein
MWNQRTPGKSEVLPNTLSGEAEPNTLSTMAPQPGATRTATQRARATSAPRNVPSPVLRLVSWVVLLIVAFAILSLLGR